MDREALEGTQRAQHRCAGLVPVEAQQDPTQPLSQLRLEVPFVGGLEVADGRAFQLGDLREPVEQHRLADAAQTDEEQALAGRPAIARRSVTPKVSISPSRPTSSGGGVPAPGRNGLSSSSTQRILAALMHLGHKTRWVGHGRSRDSRAARSSLPDGCVGRAGSRWIRRGTPARPRAAAHGRAGRRRRAVRVRVVRDDVRHHGLAPLRVGPPEHGRRTDTRTPEQRLDDRGGGDLLTAGDDDVVRAPEELQPPVDEPPDVLRD